MRVNRSLIILFFIFFSSWAGFGSGFTRERNSRHSDLTLWLKKAGVIDSDARKTSNVGEKQGCSLKSFKNNCLHFEELIETVKTITATGKNFVIDTKYVIIVRNC